MSREKHASVATEVAAAPGWSIAGPRLPGQLLLGSAAALVVARPLVFGEDPGLVRSHTDTASLLFPLCWFAVAAAWAAWCWRTRRPLGGVNGVEWGLLLAVICVFISARHATYRYPARLTAWEWAGFLVVYGVVRRVANGAAERDGLLNVLLASVVALAAHGVYQGAMELRQDRERYANDTEELRKSLEEQNPRFRPDEGRVRLLQQQLVAARVFGTYIHPDSFAEVLVLFLPGLAGACWLGLGCRLPAWRVALLAGGTTLGIVAVWMTRSRGALLGLCLAAGLALALRQRRWLASHKPAATVALVVLALVAAGAGRAGQFASLFRPDEAGWSRRLDYWHATARMIAARPWWGFGPGNFQNAYGRYMVEGTTEKIADPHNFLLEMGVTTGVPATLGLLIALVLAFRGAAHDKGAAEKMEPGGPARPEWPRAVYLGGFAGLLLGFALRVRELPAEAVVRECFAALGRGALWIGFCFLLSRISWTPRARTAVLRTGAAALLLAMAVSGGLTFPAVATLLWIVLALAAPLPAAAVRQHGGLALVAMPVLASAGLVYLWTVVYPVTAATGAATRALTGMRDFHNANFMTSFGSVERLDRQKSSDFICRRILAPLDETLQTNADNAWLHTQRANWLGLLWTQVSREKPATRTSALQAAATAQALDPEGAEPCLMRAELLMLFGEATIEVAQQLKQRDPAATTKLESEARKDFVAAAKGLEGHIRLQPRDAGLRYQLARAHMLAGETGKAHEQALEALSNLGSDPASHALTGDQIEQLHAWLAASPPGGPLVPPEPRPIE